MFASTSIFFGLIAVSTVITNLFDIQATRLDLSSTGRTFDVRAPFIARLGRNQNILLLGNENGVAQFNDETTNHETTCSPGDMLHVRGSFRPSTETMIEANCQDVRFLFHGPTPQPKQISASDFLDGSHDNCLSELTGTVKDIFYDELDSAFAFLVLLSGSETIYAPIRRRSTADLAEHPPVGSEVSLIGVPIQSGPLNRRHLGRYFVVHDPTMIRILNPVLADRTRFPDLKNVLSLRPQDISRLGRHRTSGHVLCTMRDRTFLLRADADLIVRVETNDSRLPQPGETIEAIGFPESNLYHIDLVRSTWHPASVRTLPPENASPVEPLFSDEGQPVSSSTWHGKLVHLSGKLLNTPEPHSSENLLRLECGNQIVSVDATSLTNTLRDLVRGCMLDATGICVLDFEIWRPNAAFPRIKGFTIVPRSDDDVLIVARPSWWTPQRLVILLCILIPIILGSISLNFILRRLVERRSRALLREQTAKLAESLRVDERTRLAAELHDSVAQDLTGISMQIETAEDLAADAPEKLRRILGTASRSLLNCRTELRNCLWDLRNHALDEQNLGDAIARTLKPHLEGVELALRFNVPRSLVSDATAHATLQIVRELATNAIRHGNAKRLRICGAIERQRLLFSVADDGCGFDPDDVPGAAQGHFGLSGIRERIRKLGGTITIQTSPGTGAKATITL